MARLLRAVCTFNYGTGSPGVNVFHFSPGTGGPDWTQGLVDDIAGLLYDMYDGARGLYQGGTSIDTPNDYTEFEYETGNAVGLWTSTGGSGNITVAGSDNQPFAAASIVTGLLTDRWLSGRRLAGRHFIGPVSPDAFDADGTLKSAFKTTATDMYSGMLVGLGPRLAVWHRPSTPAASDGDYGDVVAIRPKMSPGYLRSRAK